MTLYNAPIDILQIASDRLAVAEKAMYRVPEAKHRGATIAYLKARDDHENVLYFISEMQSGRSAPAPEA